MDQFQIETPGMSLLNSMNFQNARVVFDNANSLKQLILAFHGLGLYLGVLVIGRIFAFDQWQDPGIQPH